MTCVMFAINTDIYSFNFSYLFSLYFSKENEFSKAVLNLTGLSQSLNMLSKSTVNKDIDLIVYLSVLKGK